MNSEIRRRRRVGTLSCPQCGHVGLKKIMYGMPSDDFNFDKYIVGGCMPSEADVGCPECEWAGSRPLD